MILHKSDTKLQMLKEQNKANNNRKTNKYKDHSEFHFDRSCNDHVTRIKKMTGSCRELLQGSLVVSAVCVCFSNITL